MDPASSTAVLREALAGSDAALDTVVRAVRAPAAVLHPAEARARRCASAWSRATSCRRRCSSRFSIWTISRVGWPVADGVAGAHRRPRDRRSGRLSPPPAARCGREEAPLDDHPELTARVRSVLSQVILDEQARERGSKRRSTRSATRTGRSSCSASSKSCRFARSRTGWESPRTPAACCWRAR